MACFRVLSPNLLGPERSPISQIFEVVSGDVGLLKEEAHGITQGLRSGQYLRALEAASMEQTAQALAH